MPIRLPSSLENLRPYVPGKPIEEVQRELGLTEIVKLASNENPLGLSPLAAAAIVDFARFAYLYPDAGCVDLKAALSDHVGLPPDQICVGNGSDDMIHLLSSLLLEPGQNVVMGDPGFSRYEAEATANGAQTKKIALDRKARHDLGGLLEAVDASTRIVWIANPNNPTGTIIRRAEFEAFLRSVSNDVLVVLDEAYFEFATDPNYPNSADYIKTNDNVLGLRTFSKTYGLAGLRVGYAVGPRQLIDAIEKIREPFCVNALAQRGALAALSDAEHLNKTKEVNASGIKRLTEYLLGLGYSVSESYANFVWCDMGQDAAPISNSLLQQGVIVRPGAAFGCPNHLRISVGTQEELNRFEEALSKTVRETAMA
jgi:histidinol-phosphate aminotransferase